MARRGSGQSGKSNRKDRLAGSCQQPSTLEGASVVVQPGAGLLLAFMVGGAYFVAHTGDPLIGGYELPLVLGATVITLGFSGGRFKVDRILPWGRVRQQESTPESVPS